MGTACGTPGSPRAGWRYLEVGVAGGGRGRKWVWQEGGEGKSGVAGPREQSCSLCGVA